MTTLKANLIYHGRSETVAGLCLFTIPQGLSGKLEHLFLSSMFLEITSHIVNLSLHGSLFLLSAKVTKPQRFLSVLCSTHYFFFPALENSVLDSWGFTSVTLCGHQRWSTPLQTVLMFNCNWKTGFLNNSLAVLIVHQVTFTSCQTHSVSYFSISAHVLHDPDAYSESKTAELVNAGVPLC